MRLIHIFIIAICFSCSNSSETNHAEHLKQQKVQFDSSQFKCTLVTSKTVYELGEVPDFTVEISNFSGTDVYFIGALDGSENQMRMPYCYFTIEKPQNDFISPAMRCGNLNMLTVNDFVLVKSKEAFNPYKDNDGQQFFNSYEITRQLNFRTKGRYKLQFHYSTQSDEIEHYSGEPYLVDEDKIGLLFEKVPKIEISSNTIEIEFR